jgi:hypothetical protein
MNLKKTMISALLLSIGFVLHGVTPAFIFGLKPDLMLAFMFIAIMLYPTLQNSFLVGGVAGFLTALTTSLPGGQIANVIDKLITAFIVYLLYQALNLFLNKLINTAIISLVGTVLSGTICLGIVYVIAALPVPFLVMFMTGVLPAAIANVVITVSLQVILNQAMKRSNLTLKVE